MYKILIAIFFITNASLANCQTTDTVLVRLSYLIDNGVYNNAYNVSLNKLHKSPNLIAPYLNMLLTHGRYTDFKSIVDGLSDKFNRVKWYNQTRYYSIIGNPDSAFFCLKNLIDLPKKPARSELRSDSILVPLHKFTQWDSIWRLKHYSNYDLDIESIKHDIKVEDYKLALITIDKYLNKKHVKAEILYLRSLIYYKQGIIVSAIDDIASAIKKRQRVGKYYYLYAQELFILKRFKKARKAIEKAMRLNPNNWRSYSLALDIYEAIGDYSTAYEYCRVYLVCDATNVDALVSCGRLLFKLKEYIKALEYLNIAESYDSNNPYLHLWRAKTYQKLNIYSAAIHDYDISIDFLPDNAQLYFERGLCKFGIKSIKQGCIDLKIAYDMGILEAGKIYLSKCEK